MVRCEQGVAFEGRAGREEAERSEVGPREWRLDGQAKECGSCRGSCLWGAVKVSWADSALEWVKGKRKEGLAIPERVRGIRMWSEWTDSRRC